MLKGCYQSQWLSLLSIPVTVTSLSCLLFSASFYRILMDFMFLICFTLHLLIFFFTDLRTFVLYIEKKMCKWKDVNIVFMESFCRVCHCMYKFFEKQCLCTNIYLVRFRKIFQCIMKQTGLCWMSLPVRLTWEVFKPEENTA